MEFGKTYPWKVRMQILGTTEQMTAHIAVTELGLPITTDEFRKRFADKARERVGDVPLLTGNFFFYCH